MTKRGEGFLLDSSLRSSLGMTLDGKGFLDSLRSLGMTGWDACNGVVLLSFRLSPDDNRDAWRNPLEMMIIVLITRERDSSSTRRFAPRSE